MGQYPDIELPNRPAHPADQAAFISAWLAEIRKNPTSEIVAHAMHLIVGNIREPALIHGFVDEINSDFPHIDRNAFLADVTAPARVLPLEIQQSAALAVEADQAEVARAEEDTFVRPFPYDPQDYSFFEKVYVPLWQMLLMSMASGFIGLVLGLYMNSQQ